MFECRSPLASSVGTGTSEMATSPARRLSTAIRTSTCSRTHSELPGLPGSGVAAAGLAAGAVAAG
ncbi:Uncharacterised protein [Mycobacteroides abscessus subsp. abscessus]|nr:Uncharacterised protein [Mycobacteroides abscessus subsp. abscessus]